MVLFEDVKSVGIDVWLSGRLTSFITDLDVTPLPEMCYKRGGYTSYYKSKREDFTIAHQAEWREKQKNAFNILSSYKPKTVLDIGANIGWFSMLAEHLGAEVVATDIDEASISTLYEYVKQDSLNIMPLVFSFGELVDTACVCPKAYFVADMVLSLAVVHHLVFIAGIELDRIFEILSAVTKNTLVLEYVAINDDRMIALLTDSSVLNDHILHRKVMNIFETYGKDNYTFDNFLALGEKYFSSVKIFNSHPNTRKLLVFDK
jgi:SAM-dependent methyltransferase